MKKTEFYRQLLSRYRDNQATAKEMEVFFHLLETGELDRPFLKALKEEADNIQLGFTLPVRRFPAWKRWAAAAVFLLLAGAAGSYVLLSPAAAKRSLAAKTIKADVAPGGNKAVLILGNGKKILLDRAANGSLAHQGNVDIVKKGDGQIVYDAPAAGEKEADLNTIVVR